MPGRTARTSTSSPPPTRAAPTISSRRKSHLIDELSHSHSRRSLSRSRRGHVLELDFSSSESDDSDASEAPPPPPGGAHSSPSSSSRGVRVRRKKAPLRASLSYSTDSESGRRRRSISSSLPPPAAESGTDDELHRISSAAIASMPINNATSVSHSRSSLTKPRAPNRRAPSSPVMDPPASPIPDPSPLPGPPVGVPSGPSESDDDSDSDDDIDVPLGMPQHMMNEFLRDQQATQSGFSPMSHLTIPGVPMATPTPPTSAKHTPSFTTTHTKTFDLSHVKGRGHSRSISQNNLQKTREEEEMTELMQLLTMLHTNMSGFFAKYPSFNTHFPQDIVQGLQGIQRSVNTMRKHMASDVAMDVSVSDVEALIDRGRMDWNFDNPVVKHYRNYIFERPIEDADLYTDWHIPRYMDTSATLEANGYERVSISLPSDPAKQFEICANEPADSATQQAVAFFKQSGTDWILKALGRDDYLYGKSDLLQHSYVRTSVRAGKTRRLLLVKRPAKIEVDAPPPRMPPRPAVRGIAYSDHDEPFMHCVSQLEHVSTLPLIDKVSAVYVTTVLFHGFDQIEGSLQTTKPVAVASLMTWKVELKVQTVDVCPDGCVTYEAEHAAATRCPQCGQARYDQGGMSFKSKPNPIAISSLPRETRVAYMVYGIREKGGKDKNKRTEHVMLAYAQQSLIDHTQCLVNGKQHLQLWGITAEQEEQLNENVSKRALRIRQQYDEEISPDQLKEKKKKKLKIKLTKKKKKKKKKAQEMAEAGLEENGQPRDEAYKVLPFYHVFEGSSRPCLTLETQPCILTVEYPELTQAVVAPLVLPPPEICLPKAADKLPSFIRQQYEELLKRDLLRHLTANDKKLLWQVRGPLSRYGEALPLFAAAVNWAHTPSRHEGHRMLKEWNRPLPVHVAMSLLGAKYQDYTLRKFAVDELDKTMSDADVQLYLLQLVQSLKAEPYHKSPLADFLIKRALRAPYQVGHYFFWYCKSELVNAEHGERYACILEDFLTNCPHLAMELRNQNNVVNKLAKMAERVLIRRRSGEVSKEKNKEKFLREIKDLNTDFITRVKKMRLPLDPAVEVTKLCVPKCAFMSSKMAPLWLVWENAEKGADPYFAIFKAGDDLRQDILTLQMLRVMDLLWLANKLDMHLTTYQVVPTGHNSHGAGLGFIEVVLHSDTTSGIQMKYGGGAGGAFQDHTIRDFINDHNKDHGKLITAVDNFMRSCAGYVVATSVLGIGDRHNGNIMVTTDGHLFHIDFGHFLGNFKSKFGVKRERVAFVFTPDMAYVLGPPKGETYQEFEAVVCKAFQCLRTPTNTARLEALFLLMVQGKMPELQTEFDVLYIKNRLMTHLDAHHARQWILKEVKGSRDSKWRQLDNWFHNKKHG